MDIWLNEEKNWQNLNKKLSCSTKRYKQGKGVIAHSLNYFSKFKPCCPVLVPQITGGVLPAGPVMVKVSVLHWVRCETAFPAAAAVSVPKSVFPIVVVNVFGPAMTKLVKSTRS